MSDVLTFAEAYKPLLQFVGFFGGWAIAMLTGLMFAKVV